MDRAHERAFHCLRINHGLRHREQRTADFGCKCGHAGSREPFYRPSPSREEDGEDTALVGRLVHHLGSGELATCKR